MYWQQSLKIHKAKPRALQGKRQIWNRVEEFNTLSATDRTTRQVQQRYRTWLHHWPRGSNSHRTHPTTEEYILFSNAHGVLTKIDHTLVIKQNLLNVKELK